MKKILLPSLFVVTILLMSSAVSFAGRGGCPGYGYGNNVQVQIPAEKQAAYDALVKDHQKAMFDLREDMWAKHAELKAISGSANVDQAQVQALIKDMRDLRQKMYDANQAFADKLQKDFGIDTTAGCPGYGRGGRGAGRGGGNGGNGGCGGYGGGCGGGYGMMGN